MPFRSSAIFTSSALTVFLGLVLFQGVHELEHVVQVIQRSFLGIANGNGLLGSLTDVEPLHFAYNTFYLGLLVWTYLLLGLHRDGPSPKGRLVTGLLTFALAFQMWHELEHVFKLTQFVALGGLNGTGGIFGIGPGAIAPLFPIPLLHLAYNTASYVPTLVAFFLVLRRIAPSRRSRRRVAPLKAETDRRDSPRPSAAPQRRTCGRAPSSALLPPARSGSC